MQIYRERAPDIPAPVIAAGGLVKHNENIALIRRHRYSGDISLPKGKLKHGEAIEAGAIREVEEEIGQHLEIQTYAGLTRYLAANIPKVVFYFMMSTDRSICVPKDSEVAEVVWTSPEKATGMLSYSGDRELVRRLHRLGMI